MQQWPHWPGVWNSDAVFPTVDFYMDFSLPYRDFTLQIGANFYVSTRNWMGIFSAVRACRFPFLRNFKDDFHWTWNWDTNIMSHHHQQQPAGLQNGTWKSGLLDSYYRLIQSRGWTALFLWLCLFVDVVVFFWYLSSLLHYSQRVYLMHYVILWCLVFIYCGIFVFEKNLIVVWFAFVG